MHDVYALAFERDYDHLRALGGHEALEILQSATIDVMVLDLMMPDLHGMEVLDRALALRPRLIVVISSVVDGSQSALRALRRGASDYFIKLTDPDVIEIGVRQVLASHGDPAIAIPQPRLVARRVLVVGLEPGFRAALTVALQPRCRVDVAARIGQAIEMLGTMMPDLAIVDLRSASPSRLQDLAGLRSSFPEGPLIVVGVAERIAPFLQAPTGHLEILVPEPVDYALLFEEIAKLLGPDPDAAPMKSLGPASSAAMSRVVARYADHTLRVEHLSAGTGLSKDRFAHVFSGEMGIPPMDYVARVRTQAAVFMLRETPDKVGTIARRLGFYDAPHLAMRLRRSGLGSPKEFRRQAPARP